MDLGVPSIRLIALLCSGAAGGTGLLRKVGWIGRISAKVLIDIFSSRWLIQSSIVFRSSFFCSTKCGGSIIDAFPMASIIQVARCCEACSQETDGNGLFTTNVGLVAVVDDDDDDNDDDGDEDDNVGVDNGDNDVEDNDVNDGDDVVVVVADG